MQAIQITTLDGPEAVELVDVPEPTAGASEVLVDVRAAGVSFPEVLQSRGKYQISPPVGATFPLAQAAAALRLIDGRGATGKVVLVP